MINNKPNRKRSASLLNLKLWYQMKRVPIWALSILILLVIPGSNSVEDDVKKALIEFMGKLSHGSTERPSNWGWNMTSDPCRDKWIGVICYDGLNKVKKIVLENLSLTGAFDAASFCTVKSITVLSLQYNKIIGQIPSEIENCKSLTHLYLTGNQFYGKLPRSLSMLSSLKRLHIGDNNFYGELPNIVRILGLTSCLVENNQLSGQIPPFDFPNFDYFNVSNNNFSGPVPDVKGKFNAESFLGNPYLCGNPLPNDCPPIATKQKLKKSSAKQILVYSGYVIFGSVVLLFVLYKFIFKKKPREERKEEIIVKQIVAPEKSSTMPSAITSGEFRNAKSEYSLTSIESGRLPSLAVLMSSMTSGLTFEKLLKAPAELLGRGKHGSLYKVMLDNGVFLAVKRIKDWGISCEDFNRRMRRLDQVKHQNVLSPAAFYCSRQEKLLVYEYQQNGSLFKLLHGSQSGEVFDWGSRLSVAASIAEAMAFMHEELHEDGIAHGNLKSMNILFNKTMDPCISEYGLMVVENQDQSFLSPLNSRTKQEDLEDGIQVQPHSTVKADIYAFGVILLELLTGKLVQKNGFDLPGWVQSVVREEWTVDVFDNALISEGASEERMVNLLQVAFKCINPFPYERPNMGQVFQMINAIEEEEEKSISFAP